MRTAELRTRAGRTNYGSSTGPLLYYLFDVMVLGGKDVTAQPLEARRNALRSRVLSKLSAPRARIPGVGGAASQRYHTGQMAPTQDELNRLFPRIQPLNELVSTLVADSGATAQEHAIRILIASYLQYIWHLVNLIETPDITAVSVSYAAWVARGFLELDIWLRYAMSSVEASTRFLADSINDIEEFFDTVLPPLRKYAPALVTEAEKGKAIVAESRQSLPNPTTKEPHLNIGKIANDLGLGAYFYSLNGFLSKLVHPTALSVAFTQMPSKWQSIINALLKNALEAAASFMDQTEDYQKQKSGGTGSG